jgi:hypothetical protein
MNAAGPNPILPSLIPTGLHVMAARSPFGHNINKSSEDGVFGRDSLHRVLTDYVAYHMRSRTHLALGKDTPIMRPVSPPSAGRIVATPEVGGLHHRYDRIAA